MARAKAKYTITAVDKTAAALKRIRRNFSKTGKQLSSMGATMALGLTAPIAAFGVASLKAAGDFESSMNRVKGLTGEDDPMKFKAMTDQAKELGRTTSFSAGQAGDAMGFLAQAGFKTNEILGAMPSTLKLAEAAQMDLAQAADITSNILTGYGKEVSELAHVNDVLVKTTTSSNTNMEQMGEAMSYAAPVAKAAGVSFEETAAAIGLLGNAGIQGSRAGSTLAQALNKVLNPSAEASRLMKELGFNALDSSGKMLPLNDIIQQLENSGADAGDMLTLFGQRAGPGMMALTRQGSTALKGLTTDVANSGGAAEKLAKVQMSGLNGAIKKLKSAFEGLQIALAESGLLQWISNFVTRLAGWITNMAAAGKSSHQFALKVLGIVAAVGPVLFIIGKLVAAIGFLTSPIGLTIAAIGLLTLAWIKWGDTIKSALAPVFSWISNAFDDLIVFVLTHANNMVQGMRIMMDAMGQLPGAVGDMGDKAAAGLDNFSAKIEGLRAGVLELDSDTSVLAETGEKIKGWMGAAAEKVASLKAKFMDLGAELPPANASLKEVEATINGLAAAATAAGPQLVFMFKGFTVNIDAVRKWRAEVRAAGKATVDLGTVGAESMSTLEGSAVQAADGMASAIGNAVFQAGEFLSSLGNLAKSIFSTILGGFLKLGLISMVPGLGPLMGMATGGPVTGGTPYIVGEKGPELFVPGSSGTIIPNGTAIGGGGSSKIYNVTVKSEGLTLDDPLILRRVGELIKRELAVLDGHHGPIGAAT